MQGAASPSAARPGGAPVQPDQGEPTTPRSHHHPPLRPRQQLSHRARRRGGVEGRNVWHGARAAVLGQQPRQAHLAPQAAQRRAGCGQLVGRCLAGAGG